MAYFWLLRLSEATLVTAALDAIDEFSYLVAADDAIPSTFETGRVPEEVVDDRSVTERDDDDPGKQHDGGQTRLDVVEDPRDLSPLQEFDGIG